MIEKKKPGSTATATTAANKKATVIMDDTDAQGMDLVLNAEFDSALLDCWEETTAAAGTTKDVVMLKTSNDDSSSSPSNDHSGRAWDAAAAAVDTVAANHRLSALPSFIIEDEVGVVDVKVDTATFPTTAATTQQQQPPETTGTLKQDYKGGNIQEQHAVSATASVASTKEGKATSTTSSTTTMGVATGTPDHCHQHQHQHQHQQQHQHQPQQQQQQQQRATLSPQPFTMDPNAPQLHPLAIQSSARCPPHAGLTAAQAPAASDHFAMQQNSSSNNNNNNASLLPLAYNAMAAGLSFPSPFLFQAPAPYQPIGAAGAAAAMEPVNATGNSRMSPHVASASSTPTPPPAPVGASEDGSKAAPAESSSSATGQANNNTNQQRPQNSNSPPPFLLFDAPLELRANFVQSQRAHGLPVMQDNNSYHYGMAVNGFHPQQNLGGGGNIAGATTAADGNKQGHAPNVKLVDARHGDQGVKRIKNAKEQKRAQRITELIEELRLKMENGGWKVAMKSKFHTLSSCADYVKHLVKITKEKEDAVKKAKCDLEAKRQKIEDEKAQQDPSDPESTTSSLTVSSDSATAAGTNAAQMTGASTSTSGKEKDSSAGEDTGPSSKRTASGDPDDEDNQDPRKKKLRMLASHGSTVSASSTGDESAGDKARGPGCVQSLSIDQTVSTVSDITDSNKGSTTANSNSASAGSEEGTATPPPSTNRSSTRKRRHSNDHNNSNGKEDNKKRSAASSDSVSSDAAVASRGREDDSKQQEAKHFADVIIQGRKRKPHSSLETTSLNENFQLDYQEVFLSSNVPQLLATTSGRIIAWNDFFLKATGLSRNEVERLTIFSLVNPSKLSNLFEIVAAALRMGAEKPSSGSKETKETGPETKEEEKDEKGEKKDEKKKESGVDSSKKWDYAAMTLPCANFRTQRQHQGKKIPNLLYITVTLMADSDPHKRCFHCVFTDNPGTNGALGSITPDLLALLFAEPEDDEGAARPGAKKQPPK